MTAEKRPAASPGAEDPPSAVLDAGGETWTVAGTIARHRLDELSAGDVLEIISREPTTRLDVPDWCRRSGHTLLQMLPDGAETRFWIRKGREAGSPA